jgi:hypothetical protein
MRPPDPRPREGVDGRETPKTWVERYLGDGWTELEPGIYRHDAQTEQSDPGDETTRFGERQYGESSVHGPPHPRRDDSERTEGRR